ncbi:hypothetical protein MHL30_21330 [Priestia flexa]|uniref:hypothetical protein n=1 Tax=Priestia flexa TaxID=86664 RepID=UPI001EF6D26B|nr:hypothetical protein [Priestia flexa]MCG7315621.1 hypothetical protein [Priestia flexa]
MVNEKKQAEMVRVNTRISKEVNDWLDDKSNRTGIPKSTLIYLALEQYIQQQNVVNEMPKMRELLEQLKRVKGLEDLQGMTM